MDVLKLKYTDQGYIQLADETKQTILTIKCWQLPNYDVTKQYVFYLKYKLIYKYDTRDSDIIESYVTGNLEVAAANCTVSEITENRISARSGVFGTLDPLYFNELEFEYRDTTDGVELDINVQTIADFVSTTGEPFPIEVIIDVELLIN